jgi:archaellum component FlaF (FlaF/FlaG flagellin family)
MKKANQLIRVFTVLFVMAVSFGTLGCATIVRVKPSEKNLEIIPTADQGVALLVRITDSGMGARVGESADFDVIIDGAKVDTIARNQRIKIALPNGTHTISVKESGGLGKKGESNEETFTVNSDETLFHIYIEGGFGTITLKQWPKE